MRLGAGGQRDTIGHVSLLTPVTERHAIRIDPLRNYCESDLWVADTTVASMAAQLAQDYKVLALMHEKQPCWNLSLLAPTCVSVCKYHIGLPSRALTPYQLYQDLIQNYDATELGA